MILQSYDNSNSKCTRNSSSSNNNACKNSSRLSYISSSSFNKVKLKVKLLSKHQQLQLPRLIRQVTIYYFSIAVSHILLDFDGNENYSAIDLFFNPFTATFVYHGVPKCYLFTAFINTAFDKFFLLKSDSHHRPKNVFIFFNDSPSKVMKNAFYFIFKVLFVLKVFKYMS